MAFKILCLGAIFFSSMTSVSSDPSVAKVGIHVDLKHEKPMSSAAGISKHPSLNGTARPKLALIETGLTNIKGAQEDGDPADAAANGASTLSASGIDASPDAGPANPSKSLEALTAALSGAQGSSTPTAESRKLTTAAMETAIMDLMRGKSALSATPLGGSVKKIVNILTNVMLPKVADAHRADQTELFKLMAELNKCFSVRNSATKSAAPWNLKYRKQSRFHKSCRGDEAVKFSSKESCLKQQRALYQVKVLKCNYFAQISKKFGSTFNNKAIVTKAGSESVQSYIARISGTVCGKHVHGERGKKAKPGGWGGGLLDGMYDQYLKAKYACNMATKEFIDKVKECKMKIRRYNVRKGKCNQFQTLMDSKSCKHAVLMKDTCEQYAGCYMARRKAFEMAVAKVRMEERDRKAEWRGLKRISCLINAFADGKVEDKEIDACKSAGVHTDHLIVKYPKIPVMTKCVVTKLYPSTGAYKRQEFAPLPTLAKGQLSVPCSGVEEIPTRPRKGSPPSCKCRRVTLEGHFRAGPLVKCTKCIDVRRSKDRSSCPRGTKIFAPSSRSDWRTFLGSADPLRHPNWIIDITRPTNGCGGCTSNAMNSHNRNQKSWVTSDGSPWWLRSTKFQQPSGDYGANCFMDLGKKKPANENQITFNDNKCNYHSKSYYCQKIKIYVKPRKGSPPSCKCQPVTLASKYSAGMLIKCEQCLTVSRSQQKNSCPAGMKLFSPRSRRDWKTFIVSAQPLRAPHFIIDITRPQNGCGGCTRYPMNSGVANQATWRTSDGSPWWLRSTRYSQPNGPAEWPNGRANPNGDYTANCYMDLWRLPSNENSIQFNDRKCVYHSRSYYCQPVKPKPQPKPPPPPPKPRRLVAWSQLKTGIQEEVFYFKQGSRVPRFSRSRLPNLVRRVSNVNYRSSNKAWPGYAQKDNFAVRWQGFLVASKHGLYQFKLRSDDGSIMYIDNSRIVNNDGLHGRRNRFGSKKLQAGQHRVRIEFFEKGGGASISLQWRALFNKKWTRYVSVGKFGLVFKYQPASGFKQEIYYMNGLSRLPNLNRASDSQSIVRMINLRNTKSKFSGFKRADNFAVRWSGFLMISKGGTYRFSLTSDDGSRMFLNNKLTVNNDGLHGMRQAESTVQVSSNRRYRVTVEFFEKGGHAGIMFRYMGPDTSSRMVYVNQNAVVEANYNRVRTPSLPKPKPAKVIKKKR